jgi:thiol-disulfide isomerase/thioredoxin
MRSFRSPAIRASLALCLVASSVVAHAQQIAPDFAGIAHWINSPPLQMRRLRGKVVLVDFWAYSCINCLRTLPYVTRWYDSYKDRGLVVVGVHTPEFAFEKNIANVDDAVERFGIHYPVAMDNDSATWNAWQNRYWPAEYLVDRHGDVVMHHFGEGHYAETENAIRKLLGLPPLDTTAADPDLAGVKSPEMYFGSARLANLANPANPPGGEHEFVEPTTLAPNTFALVGQWQLRDEYAELTGDEGGIRLYFYAAKVHMVASSEDGTTLEISVDGKPQPPVTVRESRLYTLFDGDDYRAHQITLRIRGRGLRAFTFTFG